MINYEKVFLIKYFEKGSSEYRTISFSPDRVNEEKELRDRIRFMKQEGHLLIGIYQKVSVNWINFIK